MAFVKVRVPRTSQPQDACGLAEWVPTSSLIVSPAANKLPHVGSISKTPGPVGQELAAGTTSSYINAGVVPCAIAGGATWVAVFRADADAKFLAGTINTGSSYLEGLTLNADSSANISVGSGNLGLYIRDQINNYRHGIVSAVLSADKPISVVIQFVSSATFRFWVDGVEKSVTYGLTGSPAPFNLLTGYSYDVLNRNIRGAHTEGDAGTKLSLFARIPSLLDDPAGISANPWQLFEPEEITIWVPDSVGAGGDDGVAVNLSVTDTTDSLSSSALVTVVADVSVTDAADTLASAASALVLADLSVTDTADALSSDASILADGGVICALDVTDEPDILTADCTITGAAVVDEVVSLGGPDKFRKFDVPFHRVKVDHSVTDEDDRLYAEAKVAQLMTRIAGLSVVDADDLVAASAGIYWDQPVLVRSSLSLVKSFDLQSILAAQHMDNDQLLASLKGIARYLHAS